MSIVLTYKITRIEQDGAGLIRYHKPDGKHSVPRSPEYMAEHYPKGQYRVSIGRITYDVVSPEEMEAIYKPLDCELGENGEYAKRKRYYAVFVTPEKLEIAQQSAEEFPINSMAYVVEGTNHFVHLDDEYLQGFTSHGTIFGDTTTILLIEK